MKDESIGIFLFGLLFGACGFFLGYNAAVSDSAVEAYANEIAKHEHDRIFLEYDRRN